MTTYYVLSVKFQMAGENEGKEAKSSQSSIIIMVKKIQFLKNMALPNYMTT